MDRPADGDYVMAQVIDYKYMQTQQVWCDTYTDGCSSMMVVSIGTFWRAGRLRRLDGPLTSIVAQDYVVVNDNKPNVSGTLTHQPDSRV